MSEAITRSERAAELLAALRSLKGDRPVTPYELTEEEKKRAVLHERFRAAFPGVEYEFDYHRCDTELRVDIQGVLRLQDIPKMVDVFGTDNINFGMHEEYTPDETFGGGYESHSFSVFVKWE